MNRPQITNYSGIKKIYFDKVIKEIIILGKLDLINKKILDYGCGEKRLERLLNKKIYNYDINPEYNEIDELIYSEFNVIVINHVLMYLSKFEIRELFKQIYSQNPNCKFLLGIGKQNFISYVAKNFTFNFNAHQGTVSSYNEQVNVIHDTMDIIKSRKNIFFMTDVFYTKFKNN